MAESSDDEFHRLKKTLLHCASPIIMVHHEKVKDTRRYPLSFNMVLQSVVSTDDSVTDI